MTVTTRDNVLAEIGARGASTSLPAAVVAEFARAAMLGLCDGAPVTAQRLAGEVEDRLAPLLRFRSRAFESYFAEADGQSEPSVPRRIITDLADIGDFIDVGNGYHYPSQLRTVYLGSDLRMIIGAAPASHVEAVFDPPTKTKTIARLTCASATKLPEQTLQSWLGAPSIELQRWTTAQLNTPLERTRVCADAWETATFEAGRLKWIPAPNLADLTQIYICREPRENIKGYRKFLARFASAEGIVFTTGLRPISNVDCNRMIHGKQLLLGFSRRVWPSYSSDCIVIQLSHYTLPEILRLLKALSHDWQIAGLDRIEFAIPIELRTCVQNFLARYAMHLPAYEQ